MKRIKPALVFLLGVIALGALVLWYVGGLLSAPVNHTAGPPSTDLAVEPVTFPSTSGSTIHGWLIPGKPGRGTVVLLHGIRSDRRSMVNRARFLSRAGFSVLLFDFQAHGESEGKHITFGYMESRDAQAAVRFVNQRINGEKVGVLGVSLGGAAILLAEPPLKVDAAVLEMVYPTIEEAIADRLKMRLGTWGSWLGPAFTFQLKPRLGISTKDLRPIEHVATMTTPKLFIVGEQDQHTTLEESRRMYERASHPKEIWIVSGGGHADLHALSQKEYEQRVLAFFQHTLQS